MGNFTIESKTIQLVFDDVYGNIIAMTAPNLNWNILDRPHLGRNWELLVPITDKRNNPAYGYKQKMTSSEVVGNQKATMIWEGVETEFGGKFDITVAITVEAIDEDIVWRTNITNNSDVVVENVMTPIIGDVRPNEEMGFLKTFVQAYSGPCENPIHPNFDNAKGYWGVDVPTNIPWGGGAPGDTPFCLLRSDNHGGLYFGPYENIGEFISWRVRLFPGHTYGAMVPKEDFIGGKEVYRPFDILHLPYVRKGESLTLSPVQLRAYEGDWQEGIDVYRTTRDNRWKWTNPPSPDWATKPHSWLQIHINSPEDELRMPFSQLPKVAEECVKYGITAVQLVGWNYGGQDRNNPSHDPDPRLGGWDELKKAIAKCHEMGVKIILFSKFNWADTSTQWYKDELYKYGAMDLNGVPFMYDGYQYQTVTQLMDNNTHRFAPMCFLSDEYRRLMQIEFKKLVDLGAAGMLFDECQHHGPARFCFAENHGHRPGAYFFKNDNLLIDEFREMAGDEFLMCGEANYDMEMQTYNIAYFRTTNPDETNTRRFMRPDGARYMIAVTGFDDKDNINLCLLNNYIVSYEPYYFKGLPSDAPLTMDYGMKMQQLREETADYTWYGTYKDKRGATLTLSDGSGYRHYNVYENADGKYGVVLANYTDEPITVTVTLDKGEITRWKAVGGEWVEGNTVTLAPHYAAVAL